MICDVCDEKATVFLTQIIDGEMQKVNLCEKCANEKGVTDPAGFALADLLLGLGKTESASSDGSSGNVTKRDVEEELSICQACGFSQAQFKKAGRLGCPKCYEIFGEGLESLLKAMHKGTRHIGKVPMKRRALLQHQDQLATLKDELDQAIEKEAFEDAASLRDQILKLEAEMKQIGDPSPGEGIPAAPNQP